MNTSTSADLRKMTTADALAMARKAGQAMQSAEASISTEVLPQAARATFAAYASGLLSADRKVKGEMSQGDYATLYGKSASTVTLYRRLGNAIVVHGIDPKVDSDIWTALGKVANKKPLSDLLDGRKASKAAIRKAIEATATPNATSSPQSATPETVGDVDGKGGDTRPGSVGTTEKPVDLFEQMVARFAASLDKMSAADRKRLRVSATGLVEAIDAHVVQRAEKAPKAA